MADTHSFILDISDSAGGPLDSFIAPIEGAAFFINPLFRMLPGIDVAGLREPWYRLVPRRLITGPLRIPEFYPPTRVQIDAQTIEIVPDPTDPVRAITVTLLDLDRELYKADYTTVDVFGPLLQYLLRSRMVTERYSTATGPFRLRVTPQTTGGDVRIFELLPPDVPIEGVFPLPAPPRIGSRTSFQLVTRHKYQTRGLDAFGNLTEHKQALSKRNRVIWHPAAFTALTRTQKVSASIEVGGYLVGQVYSQSDAPDTLLVEVQQVLAAEGTSASAALLLFTADSWSALRRRLASDLSGLRLLGWWHTHLFPATDTFGLSGLDEALHRQFFTHPWHFAALLNVSREQGRVLRCYQRNGDGVLDESSFAVAAPADQEGGEHA